AGYWWNAIVIGLAQQLGITLLFLPSSPPNLNLIARLWKFTKRRALSGRYHPPFAHFPAAIVHTLADIPHQHAPAPAPAPALASLMTLNMFQQLENVALMAA
ncbi:MAG: hypothetical protein AB7I48_12855, partial [Planctomycetaceae bacterium]